jgi:hypothetical protein
MSRSRASLHLEIIALRHQLAIVNRSRRPRLRLTSADQLLWARLSQAWRDWRSAMHILLLELACIVVSELRLERGGIHQGTELAA